MKRLTPCLALLVILVPASGAAAKEPVSAKVCGTSDCRAVKDREAMMALLHGGYPVDPPDAAAFYRTQVKVRGDGELITFTAAIMPEAGLLRGGTADEGYTWMPVPAKAARMYRRITRGLEPIPAAKLAGLEPLKARVDEVVLPPAEPEEPTTSSLAWPWIVSALAGAAVLLLAVGRLRRHPR